MRAKTSAMAALLAEHDPAAFAALRERARQAGVEIRTDLELGAREAEAPREEAYNAARIELALEALRVALQRIEPNLDRLRDRLAQAKTIRLWGSLAALLLSSGIVAAVLGKNAPAALTAALLNFVAAAAVLVGQHRETALYDGRKNLADVFESLAGGTSRAETLIQQLRLLSQFPAPGERLEAVLADANALAADLRRWEQLLFGRVRSRGAPAPAVLAPASS
jgi:hypothetical protein